MAAATTRPGLIAAGLLAALLFVPHAGSAKADDAALASVKAERKEIDAIWEGGSPEIAQVQYEGLLDRVEHRDEQPWIWFRATLEARLGTLHRQLGEPDVASDWWRLALDDYSEAGRWVAAGKVLANLAVVHSEAGLTLDALSWLTEALDLHEAARRPDAVALDLYQRAQVYRSRGEMGPALADLVRSMDLLAELGPEGARGPWHLYCRGLIAHYAFLLGENRMAAEEYRSITQDPALSDPSMRAEWLLAEAQAWTTMGELDAAEHAIEQAREDIESAGQLRSVAPLRFAEASLALARDDLDLALALALEALAEFERLEAPEHALSAEVLVADLYNDLGRHADALFAARAATLRSLQFESVRGWSAAHAEAEALHGLGDLEGAADAFARAAADLSLKMDELRLDSVDLGRWRLEVDEVYDGAAAMRLAVATTPQDVERALDLVEEGRSRLLLAAVLGGDVARVGGAPGAPVEVNANLPGPTRSALGRLRRIETLRPPPSSSRALAPGPHRSEGQAAVTSWSERRARTLGASTLGIAAVRKRLPRNLGVALFRTDAAGSHVFWIERDRVEVFPLAGGEETLREAIDRYARLLNRSVSDASLRPGFEAASERLRQLLLGPVEHRLRAVRHVVVVPDADLYRVPFAALRKDDRYLVEQATVSVSPSVNVLEALLDDERDVLEHFVGVADTTLDLPRAREEVREAAGLFDRAQVVVGASADRARVLELMEGADILHFATHGELEATGDPSWLALGGGEALDAETVLSLSLESSLVTLSACRSARGSQQAGEALVNSMARSFLAAGAETVVGSLWDVHDGSTQQLMSRFYESLRAGAFVSDSLADAQRGLALSGSEYAHPWYWAGFVVIGDPR